MSCQAGPRLSCRLLCPAKQSRRAIRQRDNVAPLYFQCRLSSLLPISARLRPTAATRPQHGIHSSVLPHTWALCQTLGAHSEPLNIQTKLLRNRTYPSPTSAQPLNDAGNSYSSFPIHVALGGRAQAPSLVQGLRPRNAPLQNRASPTVCLHRNVSAGEHGGGSIPVASPRA